LNSPAKLWKTCYQQGQADWLDLRQVSEPYLRRWSKSDWIARLLKNARLKPEKTLKTLEAGCGTGIFSITLSLLGFTAEAFDFNEEALVMARHMSSQLRAEGCDLPVLFRQDNLLSIQCAANTYDLVFNQAVLEYFCDETESRKAIQEMVRVAKPGGKVAIIVQHTGHSWRHFWKSMGWPGYIKQPPVRIWTPALLAEELKRQGLKDVRVDGIHPWKCLFFWPVWYRGRRWTEELVYLTGRILSYVPLPCFLRAQMATQILAVGTKI
jgi:SAM-dependent methyltransferase